jgi:hypothetical protein
MQGGFSIGFEPEAEKTTNNIKATILMAGFTVSPFSGLVLIVVRETGQEPSPGPERLSKLLFFGNFWNGHDYKWIPSLGKFASQFLPMVKNCVIWAIPAFELCLVSVLFF